MEEKVAQIQNLLDVFRASFPPAENEAASNHLLTTEEIQKILWDHEPSLDFEGVFITKILKEAGYIFAACEEDGELGFRWFVA